MGKKVVIISVFCAAMLALNAMAAGGVPVKEDWQVRFDGDKDGQLNEREQRVMHEYVNRLFSRRMG